MDFLYYALIFFVFIIPLVLGIVIPIYQNHSKSTGGIINYDPTMKKFVYKVNLSKQQVVNLLNVSNEIDELSCTIDDQKSIIRFSEYGSYKDYYFQVIECNDFSILRLESVTFIGMQSHVPYKLNPFMINKLRAEIIPFSQYAF